MVEIFDDRVVISNPGGLPKGLEPKNFGKVRMSRDPVIASLIHRSDYIEKAGLAEKVGQSTRNIERNITNKNGDIWLVSGLLLF